MEGTKLYWVVLGSGFGQGGNWEGNGNGLYGDREREGNGERRQCMGTTL